MVTFIAGLLRYWAINIATWGGSLYAISWFLGATSEAEAFYRANRELMIAALLLHFALCCIIYHANATKRLAKREIRRLRDK